MTDAAGNSTVKSVSLKMQESFPSLSILQPVVNVFGGAEVQMTDTQLLIGAAVVAEWSDKFTKQCKVTLSLNGREVKDGDILNEAGTLVLTVTNGQGKSSTAEITLTNVDVNADPPVLSILQHEVNVYGGATVTVSDSLLIIGAAVVAKWSDKLTKQCKVTLSLNRRYVKDGDILKEAGTLVLTVTNDQGKSATADITLTYDAIY